MLEIKDIVKGYDKGAEALCGLSLVVQDKGVYAILGDKDAGKTALARVICGCEDADSGEVLVDGVRMSRKNVALKKRVRLVPASLELYGTVTANEHLDFVGDTLGIVPDKKYRQIREALELVMLEESQNKPFSALTVSERCRLSIAASLLGNPDILVLDDPFAHIEGSQLEELYGLMDMLGKIKTVILLTHRPQEVKRLCEYVYILHDGRIALGGRLTEIMEKINSTCQMYISVRGDGETIAEAVRSVDPVVDVKVTGTEKDGVCSVSVEHLPDDRIKDKLFSALAAINAPMLSVRSVTLGLEDIFYSFRSTGSKRTEMAVKNKKDKKRKSGKASKDEVGGDK
ncbi:MAG: ABC transporter ATP-binding protein [Clostridia bacterium]|nr:ABC transporter ATP-binding protein [Clostridia bacterium]